MNQMDFIVATLIWIGILFVAISTFLWTMGHRYRREQSMLLYYPNEPPESRTVCESPASAGIPNSETVVVHTRDGQTLRGFLLWPSAPLVMPTNTSTPETESAFPIPRESVGATRSTSVTNSFRLPNYVLVYFHGNAGNVGHRVSVAHAFATKLDCAVLMVDYRGFGLSSDAELTQEGLEADAQACLDFVWHDTRLPRERVVVMGTSLGGAVAIHLAAKPENAHRIYAVVVENTFTCISDMVSVLGRSLIVKLLPMCPSVAFGLFNCYIKPLMLCLRWRSVGLVGRINAPILFLSGLKDELVPPAQMRRLYEASTRGESKGLRRFVDFAEGMHNNMPIMPGYFKTIKFFLGEVEEVCELNIV